MCVFLCSPTRKLLLVAFLFLVLASWFPLNVPQVLAVSPTRVLLLQYGALLRTFARGCMMPQGYMFLALCYVTELRLSLA